jgi:hypothetical protein
MGLWYEIDRYWYSFPEYATYCATAQVPTTAMPTLRPALICLI